MLPTSLCQRRDGISEGRTTHFNSPLRLTSGVEMGVGEEGAINESLHMAFSMLDETF